MSKTLRPDLQQLLLQFVKDQAGPPPASASFAPDPCNKPLYHTVHLQYLTHNLSIGRYYQVCTVQARHCIHYLSPPLDDTAIKQIREFRADLLQQSSASPSQQSTPRRKTPRTKLRAAGSSPTPQEPTTIRRNNRKVHSSPIASSRTAVEDSDEDDFFGTPRGPFKRENLLQSTISLVYLEEDRPVQRTLYWRKGADFHLVDHIAFLESLEVKRAQWGKVGTVEDFHIKDPGALFLWRLVEGRHAGHDCTVGGSSFRAQNNKRKE
ncbi:hypothetical protein OF83DRAFT_1087013 [Amylostereum chailletii]|nr:hypothetical protein OF83DRAFT_1087013 [Amylostereum chailletii]